MQQHPAYIQLFIVIVASSFVKHNNVRAQPFGIHVEPSRQQLRTGDAYNISCWFETLEKLQTVCGSIDNLYMQTIANANLELHKQNATTVYHEVVSAKPMHKNTINGYECLCHKRSLQSARFMIGVRLVVTDFNCSFRDYEEQAALECSFSKPPFSDDVDDKARFLLQHGSYTAECSKQPMNATLMQCSIPKRNFEKFAKRFDFTLRMLDALGEQPLNLSLTREQCIVLSQPAEQYFVLNRSSDAFCMQLIDKQLSNHIGYKIAWSVELQPHSNITWIWSEPEKLLNAQNICLKHLPYPHHNYTLTLRRRYDSIDARWSVPTVYNFSTAAVPPRRPPQMWPGGYHLDLDVKPSDLIVYWQQLQELEHNGPQFTYNVSIYHTNNDNNNNSSPIKHAEIEIESNRAIIRNLNPTSGSYKIIIYSQNAVGMSENSSEIIAAISPIESYIRRMPKNLNISKSAGTFSWTPPDERDHLLGYTIYWCKSNTTDRGSCNNTLAIESEQLNIASQLKFVCPMADLYAFEWAVSANYASGGSGGMNWLKWHQSSQTEVGNAGADENLTTIHSLEGCVAIVVIGFCAYALIRKFRFMSNIKVDLPEGIVKQQEPLSPTEKQSSSRYSLVQQQKPQPSVDIPPVLNGNFKPFDIGTAIPTSTATPESCNKVDYVTIQPQQKPQYNIMALGELPILFKNSSHGSNPAAAAAPASCYVSMLSSHAKVSDYVTPTPMYT